MVFLASDGASVNLEGKRRQLVEADILLNAAFFNDVLEPARNLSLTTQKATVDILKTVESIDTVKLRYSRLASMLCKDENTVFTLPTVEKLAKITCDDGTYSYQGIALKNFTQAKSKLVNNCAKVLKSIVACFDERFGLLSDGGDDVVRDATLAGDKIVHSICKILNTKCWVECDANALEVTIKSN